MRSNYAHGHENAMPTNIGSWLNELGLYLNNNGGGVYGNTPTANIFLTQLPSSPEASIALIASGGANDPEGIDPLDRPSLAVLVRRRTHLQGLAAAQVIFNLLDNKWNILPSYHGRCIADALVGTNYLDSAGMPVYPLNFTWVIVPNRNVS